MHELFISQMDRDCLHLAFQLLILIGMQASNINAIVLGLFSSALLVLLQDSLLATASSPKFSELVMKVKLT